MRPYAEIQMASPPAKYIRRRPELTEGREFNQVARGQACIASQATPPAFCLRELQIARLTPVAQIISKEELLRHGIESPDIANTLSLSFYRAEMTPGTAGGVVEPQNEEFEPFSILPT